MRTEFPPQGARSVSGEAAHLVRRHAEALVDSYSEVLFLKGWKTGLAVLAITFLAPNVALAGVVAVLAAIPPSFPK